MIDLQLYTRPGCHLCDVMKGVIEEVGHGIELRLEELNIDDSADLTEAYGEQIPVLFVNGRKAFKYRVDAAQLRQRLEREPQPFTGKTP